MVDGKKVDLNAAKNEEESKNASRSKTTAGTGGTREAYNLGNDKAERTAAKNQSATADENDADSNENADEGQGFINRVANMDMKKLILFRILPGLLAVVLVFSLGMCMAPQEKTEEATPQKVDNVEGAYSILDDVESLKDDQISALRKQMSTLEDNDSSVSQEELAAISTLNQDAAETINPFFDAVIGIDPQASESELATHQRNLADYMTDYASTSTLYNLLSGASPAREVNQKVSKAGGVIPTWVATSGKNRRTYLVVVPVVMEEGTAKAEYLVSLNDKKIDGIDYLGLLYDSKPLETALDEQQKAPAGSNSATRPSDNGNEGDQRATGNDDRSNGNASTSDANGDCSKGDGAEVVEDENGNSRVQIC